MGLLLSLLAGALCGPVICALLRLPAHFWTRTVLGTVGGLGGWTVMAQPEAQALVAQAGDTDMAIIAAYPVAGVAGAVAVAGAVEILRAALRG